MIKRVLIVDDSSTARLVIKRCMEMTINYDVEFLEATNGVDALEVLKSEQIDLVMSDINMPEMDGIQLLNRLKSSPRLNELPVIIISSVIHTGIEEKLITSGALSVVRKPISPIMHAGAIESWTSNRE